MHWRSLALIAALCLALPIGAQAKERKLIPWMGNQYCGDRYCSPPIVMPSVSVKGARGHRGKRQARHAKRHQGSAHAKHHASGGSLASYYWEGRKTASGERFNPDGLTAAHRTLPFGSHVRVTNLHNGRSVTVRINDRGPFIRGRVIDLARGAARVVGMTGAGVVPVNIVVQ